MLRRTTLLASLAAASLLAAVAPSRVWAGAADEPAPSGVSPPEEEAVIAGSCKVSRAVCVDYQGSFASGDAEGRCRKVKGTWRAAPCAVEARVGTCRVRDTGTDNRMLTRSYKPTTEKTARAECRKQPRAVFQANEPSR